MLVRLTSKDPSVVLVWSCLQMNIHKSSFHTWRCWNRGSFNYYVGQILPNFDPLPLKCTIVDISHDLPFVTYQRDDAFLLTLPPLLVYVVNEWPLVAFGWQGESSRESPYYTIIFPLLLCLLLLLQCNVCSFSFLSSELAYEAGYI